MEDIDIAKKAKIENISTIAQKLEIDEAYILTIMLETTIF